MMSSSVKYLLHQNKGAVRLGLGSRDSLGPLGSPHARTHARPVGGWVGGCIIRVANHTEPDGTDLTALVPLLHQAPPPISYAPDEHGLEHVERVVGLVLLDHVAHHRARRRRAKGGAGITVTVIGVGGGWRNRRARRALLNVL